MYKISNSYQKYNKRSKQSSNFSTLFFKILISGIIILLGLFLIVLNTSGRNQVEYKEIEINSGDSLWSILNSHYGKKHDIREIIHQVKKINKLDNVILQPGQKIKIPELN